MTKPWFLRPITSELGVAEQKQNHLEVNGCAVSLEEREARVRITRIIDFL